MSYNYYNKEDMTKENLINNEKFIEDAKVMLGERENFFSDNPEELYDRFMEHFRYQNVNEVTATRDLFYVQKADKSTKERFKRLMDTFDKMDSDLGYDALQDYVGGVFTAPSTYAGLFSFGAGKAGAVAANQGVKLGIRELLKKGATEELKKQGIRATAKNVANATKKATIGQRLRVAKDGFVTGGYKTALGAMAVDGAASGYTVYQQERTRDDVGIKDGISLANIGLATTFSALGSGTIGAITGTSRTLSANMAEQIRQVALKKENITIESANKNFSQKVFRSSRTKKDAEKFKKLITEAELIPEKGKKKLALKETVPEKLEEGKQLKAGLAGDVEFKQAGFVPSLEEKFHENIAAAASRIINLKGMPEPITKKIKDKSGKEVIASERITSRLSRGLAEGKITDVKIFQILDEHGITMNQLSSLMVEEYSQAGRLLGKAGRLQRNQKQQLLKELTEIDQKLINLADIVTPAQKVIQEQNAGIGTKVANVYRNWFGLGALNKARIGLMTVQTATTIRNTTNGYMRNYVYALDNLGEGLANVVTGGVKNLAGRLSNKELQEEGARAVRLGVAQMRTGGQSAYGKDLWLGTKSWETEALELLFRDERFSKSDLAKQLFREMGDIGELTGQEGGIVYIARKANYLNTLSDNMFKRAIFSREIDKYLRAAGEKDGLKGFFERNYLDPTMAGKTDGKFSQLDDKVIGKAMEEALKFAYQEGKFKGKAGLFNKAADLFINASTNTPLSLAIPFPRYLVNQLIFQYEHMPILGSINLGGILNKRGAEGAQGLLKLDAESFGKQTTGLALLGAFYSARHFFGDENTGPYEYKIQGKPFDMRASIGPFMGYAFFADWLWRHTGPKKQGELFGVKLPQIHDNDKVAIGIPGNVRDAIGAFTGGMGRAGTGLWVIDTLVDNLINYNQAGGANPQSLNESIARLAGDTFNTALVGAGMLKDVAGILLDPNYRVVQDTNSVDLFEMMLNRATRSFPKYYDEEKDTPVYNSSRDRPLHNVNPFLKMVAGLTEKEKNTIVQDELARLRFDFREYTPRKMKDEGVFSNLAKGEMGKAMDNYILPYILSPDYQIIDSDIEKRERLKQLINAYRGVSRTKVLKPTDFDTAHERHRKFKARYFDIPKAKRAFIEEEYGKKFNKNLLRTENAFGFTGDYQKGLELFLDIYGERDLFPTKAKEFKTLQ